MATHLLFPARSAHVLPEPLPWEQAALVEPTAVGYRAARTGDVSGRTVAVLGSGAVGLQAAQAARSLGAASVAIADVEERRLATAEQVGVEHRIPLPPDAPEGAAAVREVFPEGADVVVECSGAAAAPGLAVEVARNGGRIVQIGLSGKLDVPLYLDRLVTKEVTLAGSVASPGVWPEVIDLVSRGQIQTAPLVTHRFPLERVEDAIGALRDRSPETVKVTLVA
jgi:threonine dehydrogenase-like Zn-dependent dehydrogenase